MVAGLELPTTMAFLGPDDILVLENEKGTVQRIIDGQIQPEPLLMLMWLVLLKDVCAELQYQQIHLDIHTFSYTIPKLNLQIERI